MIGKRSSDQLRGGNMFADIVEYFRSGREPLNELKDNVNRINDKLEELAIQERNLLDLLDTGFVPESESLLAPVPTLGVPRPHDQFPEPFEDPLGGGSGALDLFPLTGASLDDFNASLAEMREAGEAANIVLHEMRETGAEVAGDFAALSEAGGLFGDVLFDVDAQGKEMNETIEGQQAGLGELVEAYGLGAEAAGVFGEEAQAVARDVESAMASAFGSIASIVDDVLADGEADWNDFRRVALGVIQDILNAQLSASGGSGGGPLGMLGDLASTLLGSIFGGGSGGGGGNPGNPHLDSFAEGGIAPAGQFSLVGEEGPELIMPNSPSLVLPNDLSQELVAGGGNADNNVSLRFNIDARGAAPGVEELIQQRILEAVPKIVQVTQNMILRSANRGGAFARMKRV